MHRIKRQAKRNAWYNDDGSRNLNPFGKLWRPGTNSSRPPIGSEPDPELGGGVSRIRSEGQAESQAEARRVSAWGNNGNILHPQTMPTTPKSDRPLSPSEHGASVQKDPEKPAADAAEGDNSELASGQGKRSSDASGSGELRKRKVTDKLSMGGILGAKNAEDSQDMSDESKEKPKQTFTVWSQFQHTIFNSPVNILLLAVPAGIAMGAINMNNPTAINDTAIFVVNFIAIIPLAGLLSFATEEIALRVGETLGGLLNATFGNAVELIVSILALFHGQYLIVQTSLVGSMLSNLLLVMGMCFFFGGLNKVEQHFNVTVAQTAASLLALAIGSLIIPTVFNEIVGAKVDPIPQDNTPIDPNKEEHISQMSRGTAILLLLTYGCYLYFQLSTHASMYNEPSKKAERRKPKHEKGDALKSLIKSGQMGAETTAHHDQRADIAPNNDEFDDNDEEEPKLSVTTAIITLCGSTALVGVCAEYLTNAINGIAGNGGISEEFVGLILLPIVGNAAEHATAVTVAVKDKMDLAIGVAVGSSMQVIVLFVAVLLVNYLIADGKSHWLEGVLLQVLYLIIAIAAYSYPTNATAG